MGSGGMMNHDENIKTSNLQLSPDGAQITVSVAVDQAAALGRRRVGLETDRDNVLGGPMFNSWFTVTE